MQKRSSGLGKGLGALLPEEQEERERVYFSCPLEQIDPNPYQPRKEMQAGPLEELAESIREKGILQPLVVREKEDGRYELIAGERRWRAASLAGLTEVPAIIKNVSSQDRLELALIENIQRQNLNPLEEALAYQQLVKEFGLTQEEVAFQVGKERSTVANTLRLLQLPDYVKQDVAEGRLSMGHARVLLGIGDPEAVKLLRDRIINQGLSVRQTEQWAKNRKTPKPVRKKSQTLLPESYCETLSANLTSFLGTKSKIVQKGSRGRVEIEYHSPDDLERLLGLIIGQP